jgi:micrococcal nuclease
MYEYSAKLIKVVDGDTLDLEVDLGFDVNVKMRFRLAGIDTPELKSKDATERLTALEAKQFVQDFLANKPLKVLTSKDKQEKYGRYLATVFVVGGENLNVALLDNKLAKPYDGGSKE